MQELYCKNQKALHEWLKRNHASLKGIWLVFDKGAHRTMSYDDIVEELLCFGWVDSKPGKVDATKTKLWIAPRNPKSNWSAINKQRIGKLQKERRLHTSGKAIVSLAKKSGSWDALNDVGSLSVPADLLTALQKFPDAKAHFDTFPPSTKKAILEWIMNAKKLETRAKRVEETASLAQKNIRANQFRQPKRIR